MTNTLDLDEALCGIGDDRMFFLSLISYPVRSTQLSDLLIIECQGFGTSSVTAIHVATKQV